MLEYEFICVMEVGRRLSNSAGTRDSSGICDTNDNFNFVSSQIWLLKSVKFVVFVLSDAVKYASGTIGCFHCWCSDNL